MRRTLLFVPLLILATGAAPADDGPEPDQAPVAAEEKAKKDAAEQAKEEQAKKEAETQAQKAAEAKALSGMSILGNQEAPKSLVIVPWKSSELGATIGISPMLDDSRMPIDKDVFMRALSYYEIRSGRK